MGRVGAGAVIEPEHEQVPPEGLGEVELPFPISEETIAFEVAGNSMLPKYENGDIIVVFKEQRASGGEFLRRRGRGPAEDRRCPENHRAREIRRPGRSTSFNAKAINAMQLEWIGEICVILPRARSSGYEPRPPPGRARPQRPGQAEKNGTGQTDPRTASANRSAPALNGIQPEISCFSKFSLD